MVCCDLHFEAPLQEVRSKLRSGSSPWIRPSLFIQHTLGAPLCARLWALCRDNSACPQRRSDPKQRQTVHAYTDWYIKTSKKQNLLLNPTWPGLLLRGEDPGKSQTCAYLQGIPSLTSGQWKPLSLWWILSLWLWGTKASDFCFIVDDNEWMNEFFFSLSLLGNLWGYNHEWAL